MFQLSKNEIILLVLVQFPLVFIVLTSIVHCTGYNDGSYGGGYNGGDDVYGGGGYNPGKQEYTQYIVSNGR